MLVGGGARGWLVEGGVGGSAFFVYQRFWVHICEAIFELPLA